MKLSQKRADVSLDLDHPAGLLKLGFCAQKTAAKLGVLGLK